MSSRNSIHRLAFTAILGSALVTIAVSGSNAACAVSVGEGQGASQAIATAIARRDARARAGGAVSSNASFSDAQCAVADDFSAGIASYFCQVELSWCTNPPVMSPPVTSPPATHAGKHKKHWNNAAWHRKHSGKKRRHHEHVNAGAGIGYHGGVVFGGYSRQTSQVSCLRFNAQASGRSAEAAAALLTQTLVRSVSANVGGTFSHANLVSSAPACAITGRNVITCSQTARYCQ